MATRRIVIGAALLALAACATSSGPIEVSWNGVEFRRGDRVRIVSLAGVFQPSETGQQHAVDAGTGQTGTVLRAVRRNPADYPGVVTRDEPLQVLLVRFDAQEWRVRGQNRTVRLDAFETTIHAEYLRVIER